MRVPNVLSRWVSKARVPDELVGWVSASYMMAGVGVFFFSLALWAMAGATSTVSIFVRDLGLMVGVGILLYGIGIRDGIARVQESEFGDGKDLEAAVDAAKRFTFPARPSDTPLRFRHFGVMAMAVGVIMWLTMRHTKPTLGAMWLAGFMLYGGTVIGFDLGIKRMEDAEHMPGEEIDDGSDDDGASETDSDDGE